MVEMICLTLKTKNIDSMKQFYSGLFNGMELKEIRAGGVSYVARSGNIEFILFPDELSEVTSPKLQLSFRVTDLPKHFEAARSVSGVEVLMDVMDLPEGGTAMVLDPDGNSVQLIEA